ncbi:SDR family NAD(P)-dependent oxidoreductase [Nocardia sp. CA-151230]|uniref:SDR family NAD(P)-dependent oxidoreductase n=1 Tax=Nocardia sp. CA-151230 TaxID=3239982 RepID=UPI003D8B19B8
MTRQRLEGKVAIVTGAGSLEDGLGNGKAAALLFAREGARVLLVDNRRAAAEVTLSAIQDEGGQAAVFEADISDEEQVRAMVADAVTRWGRLDILDNNVGIEAWGHITDVTNEQWDNVFRINVTGTMYSCRHAIPAMKHSGGGSIINVSSVASRKGGGLATYASTKGAVEALTRSLALDYGRDGIRVNCIQPGAVYTPHAWAQGVRPDQADGPMSEWMRDARKSAAPLGIEGTGWDIGYAALFLASDEARFITGVTIPVDGGMLI